MEKGFPASDSLYPQGRNDILMRKSHLKDLQSVGFPKTSSRGRNFRLKNGEVVLWTTVPTLRAKQSPAALSLHSGDPASDP